jgi:cytochrome P450
MTGAQTAVERARERGIGRLPPGAMGHPPLGDILEYRRRPDQFLWTRYHRYGRIFKTHLGSPTVVMVGPDANRFILRDRREAFRMGAAWPAYLRFMVGDEAMSMQDGEPFLRLRTLVGPAFAADTLSRTLASMRDHTARAVGRWSRAGPYRFTPAVKALINQIMSEWVLGPPRSPQEGRSVRRWIELFTDVPGSRRDVRDRRASQGDEWEEARRDLRRKSAAKELLVRHLERVIDERRRHPSQDVVGLLCQARDKQGRGLSDSEIVAQALTLLSAGSDSTASTATWLMYALDRHPAIRARLRAEIDGSIGQGPLEWEDLRRLPYLACVLKEVQRMYPVALVPARLAAEPVEFDGYRIPEGWIVRYCILLTHFLPEVFADPERFDPDRFAPPREEDKRVPYSLIGFGAGPRHCTGKPFAIALLSVLAATILQGYEWTVLEGQDLTPVLDNNTTFKPRSRLWVELTPRAGSRRRADGIGH